MSAPSCSIGSMIDRGDLRPDFRRADEEASRPGSGTFRHECRAQRAARASPCLPGRRRRAPPAAGIIIAPTLDYMDEAFLDAKRVRLVEEADRRDADPLDAWTTASPLRASTSPACSASNSRPNCPPWTAAPGTMGREEDGGRYDHRHGRSLRARLPQASILRRARCHSPLDLERKFGLVGGDIMHGNMRSTNSGSARPVLGHGNYRAPIKGLYMCGAGAHPGGGVTGAPGHNAAHEILRDRSVFGRAFG